ncbi:hypothetical protein GCM10020229_57830 [Kitasatospora albolonga]|uniref:hypothetical protein n=1 Tax=Kitasatospora albolonga TaxID=68173 RepID=UPI0031E52C14
MAPLSLPHAHAPLAGAVPSTPLGPFADSAVNWAVWVTLMAAVGLLALALLAAVPAAVRNAADSAPAVTGRLALAAVVVGVLAVPAVLTELAHARLAEPRLRLREGVGARSSTAATRAACPASRSPPPCSAPCWPPR